ncbi:MAG: EAL domain-containing protein [Clostridiales bacterium]|nr:EAL domain-containing protein [Clostridiales bacterium]
MIDALSVQVAFLLFEAVFCIVAALFSLTNQTHLRRVRIPLTILNLLAGMLLLFDSLAYVYRGQTGNAAFVLSRVSNFIVFLTCALLPAVYAAYVSVRTLGYFSLKSGAGAQKRLITCFTLSAVASILVIVSQFTGLYYTIDSTNTYHRAHWFYVSLIFPIISMIIVFTMLHQYRKKLGTYQLIILSTYLIFPAVGMIIQVMLFGYSYMNMGIGLSAILIFIEGMLSKNNEIQHVARTEMRTGLANEHGCVEWINQMQAQPRLLEYTAIFFDLCKFSDINRKYGMNNGNEILANYAQAMSDKIGKDELLARQYGNQFVAVVRNEHVSDFIKLLKGMNVSFFDKQSGETKEILISARAGVFPIDKTDLDGEEIISSAAVGLAIAKTNTGEPIKYIDRELLTSLEARKNFEGKIEQGLKNNEFIAYYQPKVDATTKTVCGAEALARWSHDGEILSPSMFIPPMEENRSICNLDLMILTAVCKDLSRWIEQGLNPPTVSINFSRRNLADPEIADRINTIITENHIPRHLIEIEVTETADEFPIKVLKNFVDSLHGYGYLVSIDDFGCASSSLTLLREITFDTIKIDKGFVDKSYSKDLTILEHIVKMARSLELQIVAEGIEHEDQVKTLLQMGVTIIQGYYFDKPMSPEKMAERLASPKYEDAKRPEE